MFSFVENRQVPASTTPRSSGSRQRGGKKGINYMEIMIQRTERSGMGNLEETKATPSAVADLLSAGVAITPLQSINSSQARFVGADWVFVQIVGFPQHIQQLLDHPFTVKHASVVCLSEDNGSLSGVIGFALPQRIVSHTAYRDVQVGLALLYDGQPPKKVLEPIILNCGGNAAALNGNLDQSTVDRLVTLGQEDVFRRKQKDGVFRSSLLLEPGVSVETANGPAVLASLAAECKVSCPVHLDTTSQAEVIRSEGGVSGVLCYVCGRTYWAGRPRPGYDFKQFRKTFGELAASETPEPDGTRQFNLMNERYLPPLKIEDGFTLIRSPKNSGKTKALIDLVYNCKVKGLSVLLVGHRRALLAAMAADLGLDLYYQIDDDGEDSPAEAAVGGAGGDAMAGVETDVEAEDTMGRWHAVEVTPFYAISLDSLPNRLDPQVHKFDVLIVDECEQVVRHLVAKTLRKSRRAAFMKFKHYAKVAKSVYLLDADLDMHTLSFVMNAADKNAKFRIIVNEPQMPEQTYELLPTKELLTAAILEAVAAGGKTYVACNSAKKATEIALMLRKRHPDKRIELVTAQNSQQTRTQRLLRNITTAFETNLDVLVASPSVGTGIDISFEGQCVVQNVFGLFLGNIVTHFDIDQQLARVRVPGTVKIWVEPQILRHESLPEVIERELRHTILRTDYLIGYDRDGVPVFDERDRDLISLWSQIIGSHRASVNNLQSLLIGLRSENGWSHIVMAAEEGASALGDAAMKEGKALREEERAKRILDAPDIDEEEAEILKKLMQVGASMTDSETAKLERYFLREFYVCDVEEDLIAFDCEGRTQEKIKLLELLSEEVGYLKALDQSEVKMVEEMSAQVAFDRQFRNAKVEILVNLLSAAGVFDYKAGDFSLDAKINSDGLQTFIGVFRSDRRRIESELGLVMRRDIERKPVQQLGELLDKIGIIQKEKSAKKSGGQKIRTYGIDADGYFNLMKVIVRRREKREAASAEWAEQRAERRALEQQGDNGTDFDLTTSRPSLSPMTNQDDSKLNQLKAKILMAANPRLDPNDLPFKV